jgi:hypothetical protein
MATGGCEAAPVGRPRLVKTPSGNPLPRRRGQVKERIVRDIADALATAAVLACGDRTVAGAGKKGGHPPRLRRRLPVPRRDDLVDTTGGRKICANWTHVSCDGTCPMRESVS